MRAYKETRASHRPCAGRIRLGTPVGSPAAAILWRFDPVLQPVHMKALRLAVCVYDMNLEAVPRTCVNHSSRHAAVIGRLVDVPKHDFVRLRNQLGRVKILAIGHSRHGPRVDFRSGDCRILVSHVSHAVPAKVDWRGGRWVRIDRSVVGDGLNLQIDVSNGHGILLTLTPETLIEPDQRPHSDGLVRNSAR